MCGDGIYNLENVDGMIVIITENGHSNQSSNPRQACISHNADTLGKGMHPTILFLAMGK